MPASRRRSAWSPMKLMAGRDRLKQVAQKVPMLKELKLTPHQGLLHAAWSDDRLACVCTAMMNTDQLRQNIEAAQKFKPMTTAQILELGDAVLATGPTMCSSATAVADERAAPEPASGDLARLLTYHEHHGARVMAHEGYAELSEEERDWHDADLEAAREACHSHLDFAKLLPQVDKFLA